MSPICCPSCKRRAGAEQRDAGKGLGANGERESGGRGRPLRDQRQRLAKGQAEPDQQDLFKEDGWGQRRADRRAWETRLAAIDRELASEPARVRAFYDVAAHRLEPVGVIYLSAAQ